VLQLAVNFPGLSEPRGLRHRRATAPLIHRNLRSGDVHVEGHVEVAFIRGSASSPGGNSNQPADRLARAEGAVAV